MDCARGVPRSLVVGLFTTALLACHGESGDPRRRTLIDSRDNYDPKTLDPALATDVPSIRATSYLYDGLTRFTPDARLEPGLATRWEVSPDGLTYTFHLRAGVKFHDGTPMVARHVAKSWERALAPATKSGSASTLFPVAGAREFAGGTATSIRGVEAPDDSTLRVTLAAPLSVFPMLLALPVAAVVPENAADLAGKPVGTGPWKLVEWKHDDYLLFARNPDYFGGAAKADSLRARIIPEPSTAVAEFEAGNVDLLAIPEGQTREWEQTDERQGKLMTGPALRMWYVGINVNRGPLKDARVRQAINHAVDTKTVLERIMSGRGRRAAGVVPPSLAGADTARQPYAYDPAKAKQLLTQAGFPDGIDVELWHSSTDPSPRLAQAIQGYLQAAGIRAKIVQRDANAMRAAARKGETDLVLKDWFADYPDAEDFLYPLLHSESRNGGPNVSHYASPEVDRLVTAARAELDAGRRAALYRQADSVAFRDAPMLFLFFYNELLAVQPWVHGFQVPQLFNAQRWTDVEIGVRP